MEIGHNFPTKVRRTEADQMVAHRSFTSKAKAQTH